MAVCSVGFTILRKKIEPSPARLDLAKTVPAEVRDWLKDHEFETVVPHTRLTGSYARHTAILDIKDVDLLVFLAAAALDRTPNAVLGDIRKVVEEYPDALVNVAAQRRSVRIELLTRGIVLDIVPVVAEDGLEEPLQIPDRPAQKWITSDPLGYAKSLSTLNGDHGRKVVPLIKLVKTWRDEQMKTMRPKSYVLEAMIFHAVSAGAIELPGSATSENVVDFFEHIADKYDDLMENGSGVPRVADPQLGNILTTTWERSHFETFMRRVRETAKAGRAALDAESDETAADEWKVVFGHLWPSDEEIQAEARAVAAAAWPGKSYVTQTGAIAATAVAGSVRSRSTTYHGDEPQSRR